jgi:hypothetical protein
MMLTDESIRTTLDILTFAWLLGWAVKAARDLLLGSRNSVCFLLVTHFVLCGVPLLLDHLIGRPDYSLWRGFNIAAADGLTGLAYCFYVAACPIVWWAFGRSRVQGISSQAPSPAGMSLERLSWQGRTVLHLALFIPLLLWRLAPSPAIYAEYAGVIHGNFSADEMAFHRLLSAFALMSTVAGAVLLFLQRRLKLTALYVIPLVALAVWLDGKRYLVLIALVLVGSALWSRGIMRRATLLLLAPVAAVGFWGFSTLYQAELRGFDTVDSAKRYDNIRLDYGREHVIRMALYAELHPESEPILEYRMESLFFDATMLIPRQVWPEKPWPYAVYATAAALRIPARDFGWGITTSWLEEAIANFGVFGFILGPLLLAWICRIGDAARDTIVWMLTILVSSMFLAVQMPAFMPLMGVWVISMVVAWRSRREAALPDASSLGQRTNNLWMWS